MKNREIGGGLNKTPRDNRDFKLGKVFGMVPISEIPDRDFVVAEPLEIFDQKGSDMCAAFAATAVSQDQEKVVLSPEYLFAKGKQLQGEWQSWGLDLRTICRAAVKFGNIKKENAPYSL